jgi:hypothetical protein
MIEKNESTESESPSFGNPNIYKISTPERENQRQSAGPIIE